MQYCIYTSAGFPINRIWQDRKKYFIFLYSVSKEMTPSQVHMEAHHDARVNSCVEMKLVEEEEFCSEAGK